MFPEMRHDSIKAFAEFRHHTESDDEAVKYTNIHINAIIFRV